MNLYALHGFLGSPDDWNAHSSLPGTLIKQDLFDDYEASSLSEWAAAFNRQVQDSRDNASNMLLGYSLGGRLALHALLDNPGLWKSAVIISAHPGLQNENAKNERLESDKQWASRIGNESWDDWIGDWNTQPIFKHDPLKKMLPQTKDRCKRMALALQNWSLGRQNDLSSEIARLDLPILWIVGKNDVKFTKEAGRLKFKHPQSRVIAIEGAGHRVPWSKPEKLIALITQFMKFSEESK